MKLDDLFDEWRSGNISNNELRKRVAEQGAKITNPRLMPQGDPYNVEVAMPDGRILPIYDLPINRNSIPVEDLVARDQEDRNRELIRQALVREFEAGQEKGLSQAEIDEAVSQKRYQLEKKYGIDFSKAEGGEMRKGVGSLSEIARRMNEGGGVTKEQFIEDMIRSGFNPKGLRREGRVAFGEGNYDEAGIKYLMGIMGEVPFMGTYYSGLGSILERSENVKEALKNLFYDKDGRFLGASRDYVKSKVRGYESGGEVYIPSQEELDRMVERIRNQYGFDPVQVSLDQGVDPELALRLVMRESSGDQSKVSEDDAVGLTQLLADTAKEVGVDRSKPLENFIGGLRYLKKMQARFGPVVGLAAYNAGPGNVEKYGGGIPPFKETQNFVQAILSPMTGIDYGPQIQTDAETALMQMPVKNQNYDRPRARPGSEYGSTPLSLLSPILETEEIEPIEGQVTRPRARPNMVEKYGLPGDMPQGIGTLNETAQNMFR
jgi:hypothetical protein